MEQVIRVVISLLHIDLNSLGSVHSLSVPCDLGSYQVKGWARLGTAALRFCGYQLLPLANTIENSPEKRERLNMMKSTSWRHSFSQLFVVTQFIVTTCLSKIQKMVTSSALSGLDHDHRPLHLWPTNWCHGQDCCKRWGWTPDRRSGWRVPPTALEDGVWECPEDPDWLEDVHLAMDQYLLIPFLGGWPSIYQLFWCSPGVQGFDTLPLIIGDYRLVGWYWVIFWGVNPGPPRQGLIQPIRNFRCWVLQRKRWRHFAIWQW